MKLNFVINDYYLVWNLLFQTNTKGVIENIKRKIYNNYKKDLKIIYNEKKELLSDYKNYIPDNDTIYNLIIENNIYEKIYKEAEKYRLRLMSIWDKYKKDINSFISKYLKIDINNYDVLVVNKETNLIEVYNHIICMGLYEKDDINLILKVVKEIIIKNTKNYPKEILIYKDVIIELLIDGELKSMLLNKSTYKNELEITSFKRYLYPYILMFMGCEKDRLYSREEKDNIIFDINKYTYERQIKNITVEEFIDFCVRNRKHIQSK